MSDSGSALPDYAQPPVVEVVFAVALGPLPLSVVDLARFGLERLGDAFPLRSEQPPMQMAVETFDRTVQMVMPTLALLTGPPPVRLWFQSEDKTRLVQVQRDWLACNWQGASTGAPYPRYESNETFFCETWDGLSQFVEELGHGPVSPNQCELTYINHIVPGELWARHGQMGNVLRLAGEAGSFLPEPEDGQVVFRYRIPYEGRDVGRLYVQATPALRPEDLSPVIQLQIVARGAPLGAGRNGMVAFFRLAHEWIVNGFAAVTTDAAQRSLWERKQ
jgi:uncharacterized protein (TIGR04255 family)